MSAAAASLLLASILTSVAPVTAGSVSGRVTLTSRVAAPPKKIEPTTDAAICGQQDLADESLLVDPKTKGVKNVVLRIAGTKQAPPIAPAVIDNYRCRFEPHVIVVAADSEVTVRNRDRFLHTSQAKDASGKSQFNVALPNKDQEVKRKLAKPGPYSLQCDVHDWMRGFVFVTGGEMYAVTGDDGTFSLGGVPAGKHQVSLWHETLGEKTAELTVTAGGATKFDVSW